MLFLVQDGITSGAIYALLGLALVLVFAVTRVILIPQGEFVTFGALTYATLSTGRMPGTAWLAVVMGVVAFGLDLFAGRRSLQLRRVGRAFALNILLPVAIYALTFWLAGKNTPIAVNIALSLLIVAAIGLFLYRIVFQPLAHTSVLVLLIASVGCPSRAAGPRPGVLRRRGPARPGDTRMPPSRSARCVSPARASRSTPSPSPSSSACGCSSASRSMARRCAPLPSTGSARGWSASAPRCRDRSHSCWPR